MTNKKVLLVALFLLALGAFSLHMRIHPVYVRQKSQQTVTGQATTAEIHKTTFNGTNFTASLFCFLDLVLVTWLFCYKETAVYAFLLNGMLAILGIILMGHFTVAGLWGTGAGLWDWLYLKSTMADIMIAASDFLIGKALYDLHMSNVAN